MKRFVITEDEKKSIKGLYGLMEQSNVVVSIRGEQPYPNNTDWDLVHGILGSKRIDDDLEKRVGDKLKEGNYRVVGVNINSYVQGNKVVTDGKVTLVPDETNPDVAFTTRGSIGDGFDTRHDGQVNGLGDRLSQYYGGQSRQFGPFTIDIKGVKYKQSFFAISKNKGTQQSNQTTTNKIIPITIFTASNLDELYSSFKEKVSRYIQSYPGKYNAKDIRINVSDGSLSATVYLFADPNGFQGFSLLFNPKGQQQLSKNNALAKNPTAKVIKSGEVSFNNKVYEYHLVGF